MTRRTRKEDPEHRGAYSCESDAHPILVFGLGFSQTGGWREKSLVPSQSVWNDHTYLHEWVLLGEEASYKDEEVIRPVVGLSEVAYFIGRGQRTSSGHAAR